MKTLAYFLICVAMIWAVCYMWSVMPDWAQVASVLTIAVTVIFAGFAEFRENR